MARPIPMAKAEGYYYTLYYTNQGPRGEFSWGPGGVKMACVGKN
jgi:hypothetical protein